MKLKDYIVSRTPKKIRDFFFFSFLFLKMIINSFIIYIFAFWIFPIDYKIFNIRIGVILGLIILGGSYYYWEKFIKRKLHKYIIGDYHKL